MQLASPDLRQQQLGDGIILFAAAILPNPDQIVVGHVDGYHEHFAGLAGSGGANRGKM
jgi:hypothetical protein